MSDSICDVVSIEVNTAGEVSVAFQSELDRPWRLQRSTTLENWLFNEEPVMGNGEAQTQILVRLGPVEFFRVFEFAADAPYKPELGPYVVAPFEDESWLGESRDYDMPVRIFAPALDQEGAPYATLILSHGFLGRRGLFDTLADYLASHGYICVMTQHNDLRLLRRIQRPADITFAIDYLLDSATNPLVQGRLDETRIGIAGHSFGAFTALAMVGAQFEFSNSVSAIVSYPDERIRCAVAMSPQGPGNVGLYEGSWDLIEAPTLTMLGTLDIDQFGTEDPLERRIPYDSMSSSSKYLLALEDAQHFDFSDNGIDENGDRFTQWYFPAILAFFDAHINDNPGAENWLHALTLNRLSSDVANLESQ